VVAGLHASIAVQARVHRINAALGNTGHTVLHTDPLLLGASTTAALSDDMAAGRVQALLMLIPTLFMTRRRIRILPTILRRTGKSTPACMQARQVLTRTEIFR